MNAFTRNAETGVYTLKADARVTVATHCDCSRSRCAFKWAVYVDRGMGSESVDYTFTLAEAKASAPAFIDYTDEYLCPTCSNNKSAFYCTHL